MALLMDPNPFALSILNDPRFASLFQHPSQAVLPSLPAQTALASQRTVVLSCKDEDRIVQALYHTRTHSKMTTLEVCDDSLMLIKSSAEYSFIDNRIHNGGELGGL